VAPSPLPAEILLRHKVTGEERMVSVTTVLERAIIVVHWPGCGDYALRLTRNEIYGYGPAFGVRRTPTGWGATDIAAAWRLWHDTQEERRKRLPVRTHSARAYDRQYPRK
jgi:hypothetical protein